MIYFRQFFKHYKIFALHLTRMAKSKYEYVRNFESEDKLLPNCWLVVRVDGKGFHKFSNKHNFQKPNDLRALQLMNRAAVVVMQQFKDIVLSYGQSDEYSFVFRKETDIYNRRGFKISSYINSTFTSSYVFYWKEYFSDIALLYPPAFDARVILYPTDNNLCDYLSWRQVDTHVNNLYNTTFWNLIQKKGLTNQEALERLSGTVSSDKNEILFSEFGINYNNEPIMYRKGTVLMRKKISNPKNGKLKQVILPIYEDMMHDKFWNSHSEILNNKSPDTYDWPEEEPLPNIVLVQLNKNKNDSDEIVKVT